MTLRDREPLYDLLDEAPVIPAGQRDAVVFPFSNDDSMYSFRQARHRTGTPEYQGARRRVAVIIGESALATNLLYVPEETIVMLGNEPNEVRYMGNYGFSLQMANDREGWLKGLEPKTEPYKAWHRSRRMEQARWWNYRNKPSALTSDTVFLQTQEAALRKAFIPWYGDVTSEEDMGKLGAALRKYDATVTLLNLTNVIPYSTKVEGARSFPTAAGYANVLERLPMTPDAPILTTSSYRAHPEFEIVHATGPFYGLDDLRTGGDSKSGPIAIHRSSEEGKRRQALAQAALEGEQ